MEKWILIISPPPFFIYVGDIEKPNIEVFSMLREMARQQQF